MKLKGRIFSAVFSLITACLLGIAFIFSIVIGFGGVLSDVKVPGLSQRLSDTWSPLKIRVFLFALILVSAALLILAFTRINHASSKKRLRIFLLLAGVFLLMQLFIVFGLHTIQNTDAFEVQDQALAIAKGIHKTVDYTKSSYFRKYGNNDLYLIFCVQVFRFCLFFHIRTYSVVFALLNLAAVDLGIFMTCRTVFLLKGSRAALKVFLLSILNPAEYTSVMLALYLHPEYADDDAMPMDDIRTSEKGIRRRHSFRGTSSDWYNCCSCLLLSSHRCFSGDRSGSVCRLCRHSLCFLPVRKFRPGTAEKFFCRRPYSFNGNSFSLPAENSPEAGNSSQKAASNCLRSPSDGGHIDSNPERFPAPGSGDGDEISENILAYAGRF
jgi:hypothetical protein